MITTDQRNAVLDEVDKALSEILTRYSTGSVEYIALAMEVLEMLITVPMASPPDVAGYAARSINRAFERDGIRWHLVKLDD